MTEYITKDAVREMLGNRYGGFLLMLDAMPTADVAPVVRCKDCKYHRDCGSHYCTRLGMDCPDDSEFFCSYGKYQTNTGGNTND